MELRLVKIPPWISLVAKRCVFLRNGRSASQPHIELFALLTFALPRCIKSHIADFIAPGMAAQLHSPVSTTDPLRQKMGCVLQLCNGATAEVTKCQFGANGVVAHTQLNGPWFFGGVLMPLTSLRQRM